MKVVLIDYGAGNIKSLQFALERLGVEGVLSSNPEEIKQADKVIFPGVGEASSAMQKLKESGLDIIIPNLKNPVLGICLGMQLMCSETEEGSTQGLNIFDVSVKRFNSDLKELNSPLFNNLDSGTYMYSVHSFYAALCKHTVAQTNYGIAYSSALQKDNFYGVQFHPEKSSKAGSKILTNFLEL
jgi:glutamine amidotransferase